MFCPLQSSKDAMQRALRQNKPPQKRTMETLKCQAWSRTVRHDPKIVGSAVQCQALPEMAGTAARCPSLLQDIRHCCEMSGDCRKVSVVVWKCQALAWNTRCSPKVSGLAQKYQASPRSAGLHTQKYELVSDIVREQVGVG